VGTPADCPPSGAPSASDEGICGPGGSLAAKRCKDFKEAFKPKVAEAAVACLRKLTGKQVCDAARVNKCGHEALMLSCQEPVAVQRSYASSGNLSQEPAPQGAAPGSPVVAQCDAILKGCAGTVPGVSLVDCTRTLSGMNDAGRSAMVECMKTHCADRGLYACEASRER
jgi:hypothetical protein